MEKIPVRHVSNDRLESDLLAGFNIRCIEELLTNGDIVQNLHRHSFFYILVLKEGIGEHKIDFDPFPVAARTVVVMRPGQVHQLLLRKGSRGFMIQFSHEFYPPPQKSAIEVFRKVSARNYYSLKKDVFNSTYATASDIFSEFRDKQERYHDAIRSDLEIFFIRLLRASCETARAADTENGYMQKRLEEFMELLPLHITTHKEVTFYAKELHLTSYQLNAVTKALLDKTCSEVINGYVILEAKRYLLATSNLVSQIAWLLGYEDVSYFTRFFKKQTGHTPEAFRCNFR